MKTALTTLAMTTSAIILCMTGAAAAVEYRTPVTKQLFTCATSGLTRVAASSPPAACCEGQLKCAQFLSTTGVLQPWRHPRT